MIKLESVSYCDFCRLPKPIMSIKYPILFYADPDTKGVEFPFVTYEDKDICAECMPKAIPVYKVGDQSPPGYHYYGKSKVEYKNPKQSNKGVLKFLKTRSEPTR